MATSSGLRHAKRAAFARARILLIIYPQTTCRKALDHCAGRTALRPLLDPQLFDSIPQRPEAHSEQLCRRGLVVASLLQSLDDGVALDLLEVLAQCGTTTCRGGWRDGNGSRQARRGAQLDVFRGDHATNAKGEGALENVLELAHVPGEGVGLQLLQGVLRQLRGLHSRAPAESLQNRSCDLRDVFR